MADAQEKSAGEAMAKVKVILQKVYASLGEEFVDGEEFDGAVVREPTPSSAHVGSYRLASSLEQPGWSCANAQKIAVLCRCAVRSSDPSCSR